MLEIGQKACCILDIVIVFDESMKYNRHMSFRSPLHRALFRSAKDLGPGASHVLDFDVFWAKLSCAEAFDPFRNFFALIGYCLGLFFALQLSAFMQILFGIHTNTAWIFTLVLALVLMPLLAGSLGALALFWASTISELSAELKYFKEHSEIDHLSGLKNRRGFEERMGAFIAGYRRGVIRDMSLLFLDIDHFKKINDTWGHGFGDEVIKAIAEFLERKHRGNDLSARWGGEEFVILAMGVDLEEAIRMAERIRMGVEALDLRYDDERVQLTVSIGVTSLRPEDSREAFLERADSMLYEAKSGGRNCVKWVS